MEKKTYIERIDAYLKGELLPADRQAFEAELSHNTELQEQLRWHRLALKTLSTQPIERPDLPKENDAFDLFSEEDESLQDRDIRAIANRVRQRVGKLPEPSPLSMWERLAVWFKTPWAVVSAGLTVAALSVLVYTQNLPSTERLAIEYFFKPANASVAGKSDNVPNQLTINQVIIQLSKLYFLKDDKPNATTLNNLNILRGSFSAHSDSLKRILIDYYAAHADFELQDYKASRAHFEGILATQDLLTQPDAPSLTKDVGKIKFNYILATLVETHDETRALTALEKLENETKGNVKMACQKLILELKQPLRRFKF